MENQHKAIVSKDREGRTVIHFPQTTCVEKPESIVLFVGFGPEPRRITVRVESKSDLVALMHAIKTDTISGFVA